MMQPHTRISDNGKMALTVFNFSYFVVSGAAHGDCAAGCLEFWSTKSILRPAIPVLTVRTPKGDGGRVATHVLKVTHALCKLAIKVVKRALQYQHSHVFSREFFTMLRC